MIEYMAPYDDMKDVNTHLVKSEKTASETLKSRRESGRCSSESLKERGD